MRDTIRVRRRRFWHAQGSAKSAFVSCSLKASALILVVYTSFLSACQMPPLAEGRQRERGSPDARPPSAENRVGGAENRWTLNCAMVAQVISNATLPRQNRAFSLPFKRYRERQPCPLDSLGGTWVSGEEASCSPRYGTHSASSGSSRRVYFTRWEKVSCARRGK